MMWPKIKFEPRDLWVGVYWTRSSRTTTLDKDWQHYTVYVCVIPCFPIIFAVKRSIPISVKFWKWDW